MNDEIFSSPLDFYLNPDSDIMPLPLDIYLRPDCDIYNYLMLFPVLYKHQPTPAGYRMIDRIPYPADKKVYETVDGMLAMCQKYRRCKEVTEDFWGLLEERDHLDHSGFPIVFLNYPDRDWDPDIQAEWSFHVGDLTLQAAGSFITMASNDRSELAKKLVQIAGDMLQGSFYHLDGSYDPYQIIYTVRRIEELPDNFQKWLYSCLLSLLAPTSFEKGYIVGTKTTK